MGKDLEHTIENETLVELQASIINAYQGNPLPYAGSV